MVSIVVHLLSFPKLPFWVPAWPALLKTKSTEEKIPLALTSQNQGKEVQECLR